uniref:CCHC-type domain-containing protein n=1 Tax=Solanum tuberosum TaxID=4113 RepID=M1DS12_SOLTU
MGGSKGGFVVGQKPAVTNPHPTSTGHGSNHATWLASRVTLFGVGNTRFHVKLSWSMSVKAYSHNKNMNMNNEPRLLQGSIVDVLFFMKHKRRMRSIDDVNERGPKVVYLAWGSAIMASIPVARFLEEKAGEDLASIATLFSVGNTGFHVKLTWSMSVKAYSHNKNMNLNNEPRLLQGSIGSAIMTSLPVARIFVEQASEDLDMTAARANVRRNEEDKVDQEVPPQAPPQVLIDPLAEIVTNEKLRCYRRHVGKCLAGSNVCFDCGELGHKIRHCPTVARNEGDSRHWSQPYPSSGPIGLGANAPKKIRFYDLQARGEQEYSLNVDSDMCSMLI